MKLSPTLGDFQGHRKERHFVNLDLRCDAGQRILRVYATDASKTLLPLNILIALRASGLLHCSAVLYIHV